MSNHLSSEHNGSRLSVAGVILSIMAIGIAFVLIRALNPVYGQYIINQEYVTILLALLVASVLIAVVLRRAQKDLDSDESYFQPPLGN
jgi:multisubunit Na+/H+ antiporter MnhG subunit